MKELGEGKCVSRKLSPGSVETIRNGLFYYRTDRPAWIERYFPAIAQRGYIDYEDIDAMSEEQAGATRLLLTDGLVYWLSKLRKARAAGISLRPDRPAEGELAGVHLRASQAEQGEDDERDHAEDDPGRTGVRAIEA